MQIITPVNNYYYLENVIKKIHILYQLARRKTIEKGNFTRHGCAQGKRANSMNVEAGTDPECEGQVVEVRLLNFFDGFQMQATL